MQRGEWWITDYGTEFADPEVGNWDHESIAFYRALGLSLPDEGDTDWPQELGDLMCCRIESEKIAKILLANGADPKAVTYFRGGNPDARLWAAKEMGWIRVVTRAKSAEAQLWGLDDEKLKLLQSGEMWDDDVEFEEPNATITIEDVQTGWTETVPLAAMLKASSAARLKIVARGEGESHGLDGHRGDMNYETPEERLMLASYGKGQKRCIIRREDGKILATGSPAAVARTAEALGFHDYETSDKPSPKRRKSTSTSCSSASLEYAWLRTELCISNKAGKAGMPTITDPAAASTLLHSIYDLPNESREVILVLAVDNQNRPLGMHVVAAGGIKSVAVEPGSILRPVLLLQATGFFLFHNHPSGNLTPSADDERLTERVKEAAAVVDVKFLDHIILTADPDKFYSFFVH